MKRLAGTFHWAQPSYFWRVDDVDTSKLPPIEPRNVDIITIDPKEEITSKLPPIEPRNGVETTSKPCVSPPCCPNCPPGRWGCYCQFYHDPRRSDEEAQETTSKKPCFEIDPPCCPSCPPGYMGCYCENYHEPRSDQEVSLKLPWVYDYWDLLTENIFAHFDEVFLLLFSKINYQQLYLLVYICRLDVLLILQLIDFILLLDPPKKMPYNLWLTKNI